MKKAGYFIQHSEVNEEQLSVSGTSIFHNDICVKIMKNLGHCKVAGKVESINLINRGSITTDVCQVESIKNAGTMLANEIIAKTINTSGNFHCKRDVRAEWFQAKGTVNIKGNLIGKTILMEVGSFSFVQHMISNENINIKPSKFNILSLGKKELRVQQIEGKSIYLESVTAKYVVGENVIVGPNCEIEKISYRKELRIHKDSKVISAVKEEGK